MDTPVAVLGAVAGSESGGRLSGGGGGSAPEPAARSRSLRGRPVADGHRPSRCDLAPVELRRRASDAGGESAPAVAESRRPSPQRPNRPPPGCRKANPTRRRRPGPSASPGPARQAGAGRDLARVWANAVDPPPRDEQEAARGDPPARVEASLRSTATHLLAAGPLHSGRIRATGSLSASRSRCNATTRPADPDRRARQRRSGPRPAISSALVDRISSDMLIARFRSGPLDGWRPGSGSTCLQVDSPGGINGYPGTAGIIGRTIGERRVSGCSACSCSPSRLRRSLRPARSVSVRRRPGPSPTATRCRSRWGTSNRCGCWRSSPSTSTA